MKMAINASRARSGGAKTHLHGIISSIDPWRFGFETVYIWAPKLLLQSLPEFSWLIKCNNTWIEGSLFKQLLWEKFIFIKELKERKVDIILNIDAGTICPFLPAVTMSRDMLAFEPGEAARLGFGRARLRQLLLKYIQCQSLSKSNGVIFLTNYAARMIGAYCGKIKSMKIVPHGVSASFERSFNKKRQYKRGNNPIQLLYVSPVWLFKHQWHVVRAVEILRDKGLNVFLRLVGGGDQSGLQKLNHQISKSDRRSLFVDYVGEVPHKDLPIYLSKADIFVFASSCENMPNSLIEAMKSSLPIACSDRGPMPEILQDGGIYFDPENPDSIANVIETLINDADIRERVSRRAFELSKPYSWVKCAHDTFEYISQISSRAKRNENK